MVRDGIEMFAFHQGVANNEVSYVSHTSSATAAKVKPRSLLATLQAVSLTAASIIRVAYSYMQIHTNNCTFELDSSVN
eukprot:1514414-Amphidinium_carterae.1